MFSQYGQDWKSPNGMPAVMKIKRKSKGVGCEIKNLANSASRIIFRTEVNEGKDTMATKVHQKELGTGTTKRGTHQV